MQKDEVNERLQREQFPLNVHNEISMQNEGVSTATKKNILRFALAALSLLVAWTFYTLLKDTTFGFLGAFVGLALGIAVSIFLWNKVIVDKDMEKFEDSRANKIFKFFKFSLSESVDQRRLETIETIRYTTGEYAIMLSISIGNITKSGELLTEEFFDKLFLVTHKNKVRMKIFTLKDEWETSEMHLAYLKRISGIQDKKLKETLAKLDKHQSEQFQKSFVSRICIIFYVKSSKFSSLKTVSSFVEQWRSEYIKLSSMRECRWQTRDQMIKIGCEYLGVKMIDVSPLADKEKKVMLDVRKLMRPYRSDLFFTDQRIQLSTVDTNAFFIRRSKLSTFRKKKKKRLR